MTTAVIVDINEGDPPAEQLARPKTGMEGHIGKKLAVVVVKRECR